MKVTTKELTVELDRYIRETKIAIALLFSTTIGEPDCFNADWENEENPCPDQVIGNHNDWWLKSDETDGSLYVQCRYQANKANHYGKIVKAMTTIARKLEQRTGIKVGMPHVKS
jgi:hypothetical protein